MHLEDALKELQISRSTFHERVDALEREGSQIHHHIATVNGRVCVGPHALKLLREYGDKVNSSFYQYTQELLVAGAKTFLILAVCSVLYSPLLSVMVKGLPSLLIVFTAWICSYRPRIALRFAGYVIVFGTWLGIWKLLYQIAGSLSLPDIPRGYLTLLASIPLWILILLAFSKIYHFLACLVPGDMHLAMCNFLGFKR
jgi:hypothetical protein